jgi:uncharacterized SAM-binding protein YcdF (DUF218 family)
VLNHPEPADAILVLAGETDRRPAKGVELLQQGYAPRMILNVPASATIYGWRQTDIAGMYVHGLPQGRAITICPTKGLSTKAEAKDAAACLSAVGGTRIMLVTSDYHTRRALSVFQRELPEYRYSVAAAYEVDEFGTHWWQHRQWAKRNFDEWVRLAWWELVDRWHK